MRKLLSLPVHKIIFCFCFLPFFLYILVFEFWLSEINASTEFAYKCGQISSKIAYSITAASIFYFVAQYIGVYIPRQQRKIKILSFVKRSTIIIDVILSELKNNLINSNIDIKDSQSFRNAIANIDTEAPVNNFIDWYQYLFYVKTQVMDLTKGLTFYHDYLEKEYFHELLLIQQSLLSPIVFVGHKVLLTTNLSYAEIELQELLIHNQHLQGLWKKEYEKYKEILKKEGEKYRRTYYGEIEKKNS
jgi:hypothetical protein